MDEDAVLRWVMATKEEDADIIEEVDAKELEKMLDAKVNVVVYFCKCRAVHFIFLPALP